MKVKDQVAKTPNATANALTLAVGKEFLMQGFINESGIEKMLIKGELSLVFEKWSKFNTSSMNNIIFDAKLNLGGKGHMDDILKLKKGLRYDYVHKNYFSRHENNLVYIFKMFTVGPRSSVDLVQWM